MPRLPGRGGPPVVAPDPAGGPPLNGKLTLRSHQDDGIAFLRAHPRSALWDEAGTGKTAQLLCAAEGPTLAVAPAMVIDAGVWDDEHQLWAPELDLTTISYHQVVKQIEHRDEQGRLVRAGAPWKFPSGKINLNRGNVKRIWTDTPTPELLRAGFQTVILDEAHNVKGRDTHWTKALFTLARRADRVILSTGTPLPNWAHESFTLLRMLYPEDSSPGGRFGSYWKWVGRWFPVGPNYAKSGRLLTRHHVTPRMLACPPECPGEFDGSCAHWKTFREENFGDVVIQRSWDDLGYSLPPLTGWTDGLGRPALFKVKMTPEQSRVYKQLKKQFVAWADDGTQIESWSQAGLQTRLRQVACGLEVADPSLRGSGKLDAMQELLDSRRGGVPTVVIAWHHNTMDAIRTRLDELGMKYAELSGRTPDKAYRRDVIQRFKNGGLPVLIGQIDTVAEGLTLTRADRVIMVESSYRPDRNEQVVRKLGRLGQIRPVHVDRMATMGTIDINIMRLLHEKKIHQLAALPPGEYARLL